MLVNVLASLLASFYGAVRGILSIAIKAFTVYGALVLLMAWASDRIVDAVPAFAPWIGYSVALVVVRAVLDTLTQRGIARMTRV